MIQFPIATKLFSIYKPTKRKKRKEYLPQQVGCAQAKLLQKFQGNNSVLSNVID